MSINVYLKDEVQKLEGFTTKPRKDRDGGEWNEYGLPGVKLSRDKGRWYIVLYEPTEPVPAVVADVVEEISLHEVISSYSDREAGIYRHESAEAEVETFESDKIAGENRLRVRIRAKKKMEDLLELYRKIKVGSIRPEQSYEGEQDGVSCAELEEELEVTKGAYESLKADLRTLCRELDGGWPFCAKTTAGSKIKAILNNHCD